jgi:two-component system response regulator VanR
VSIKILIVEDDPHIRSVVSAFLTQDGYEVSECADGDEALELFYQEKYQLLILDILLPGVNGFELLKEFRRICEAPVLMMTALTDDRDQLSAFNNLADDYVTKPFSTQILLKRVEALLRRSGALRKMVQVGNLILDTESFIATCNDQDVALTRREFDILLMLAQNCGKVITYERILSKLWGYDYEQDERILQTKKKNLRNKLPENVIKTVRGIGYSIEK